MLGLTKQIDATENTLTDGVDVFPKILSKQNLQ